MNSVTSNSKSQRYTLSGCKDIGMNKIEFVAQTQLISVTIHVFLYFQMLIYIYLKYDFNECWISIEVFLHFINMFQILCLLEFKLHPATDGFPDALTPSDVKRSVSGKHFFGTAGSKRLEIVGKSIKRKGGKRKKGEKEKYEKIKTRYKTYL